MRLPQRITLPCFDECKIAAQSALDSRTYWRAVEFASFFSLEDHGAVAGGRVERGDAPRRQRGCVPRMCADSVPLASLRTNEVLRSTSGSLLQVPENWVERARWCFVLVRRFVDGLATANAFRAQRDNHQFEDIYRSSRVDAVPFREHLLVSVSGCSTLANGYPYESASVAGKRQTPC